MFFLPKTYELLKVNIFKSIARLFNKQIDLIKELLIP